MRRNWLRLLGSLCLFGLTTLTVGAQEELPAPEKATDKAARPAADQPPTREERRERRRRLVRGLVDQLQQEVPAEKPAADGESSKENADRTEETGKRPAGAPIGKLLQGLAPLFSSPPGRVGQGGVPLEPEKLNRAIDEELVRPLVGQLDNIEALELRFDQDHTDFATDRLGVTTHVRVRSAPWGAPADLRLRINAGLGGGLLQNGRALLKFHIDMTTDAVALCNFLKYRALQRCYKAGHAKDATEDHESLCRLLESTPDFTSLADVADFIPNMGIVNLQAANRKIESLQAQMQAAAGATPPASLIDALAKAYKARDSLLAASIRVTRDGALQVPRIDVQTASTGAATEFAEVEFVDVTITPDGFHGDLHGSIGRGGVLLYQGAKGLLIEPTLRRLQQRDSATLERLRQGGRDIHQQMEELETPAEGDSLPVPNTR
ncbi:MAG: hypothetical protein ACC645_20410 [Pirellulales bacterium]